MYVYCVCGAMWNPTVGGELVPLKDGEAEDVLIQVFDEEVAVEVPFGVERVGLMAGRVALSAHS